MFSTISAHHSGPASLEQPDELVEVVEGDLVRLGEDEGRLEVAVLEGLGPTAILTFENTSFNRFVT